jgi:hypothetical protein
MHSENNDSRDGVYSFSQSSTNIFIANHLDKFAWICILFLTLFTIIKVGYLSLYGIGVLILLCTITYLFGKILNNFVYKIILDFNSRRVRFHTYRKEDIIVVDFEDIKSIRVNGYIILAINERKVFYNNLHNSDLLKCLNTVKKIDWGFLCCVWGPEKNLRDSLSGDIKKDY